MESASKGEKQIKNPYNLYNVIRVSGNGAYEIRTHDLLHAMQALSQLS
jgi:hypothetical protein